MSVAENIASIRRTLRESLDDAGVTLVAVSKSVGVKEIEEAFNCGVTEFGENRIQDALRKQEEVPPHVASHIRWHFIGHLQTNKVRKAVGRFELIHSVDSLRLAREVSQEAVRIGVTQPVLLQVKVAEDPNKSGFGKEELEASAAEILELAGLEVRGLMTMLPIAGDTAMRKKCFSEVATLRDHLCARHEVSLPELSMGMSDDWREAVICGATMIRIGRAIFSK